ncbi:DUF3613 domain-containing protein [Pseudomonas protegens]|uniref:DUF3613 domain-containing protein n=1 Tax=Pseudomonas protegens TaxID=380021 RepID=UPI00293708A8|nr:DUF3613 domain-containing protein [Pseudomonas protegens]WOE81743.1 DUF3613 domain-containing protein [Pseudomonas protegens]
MKSKIVSALGLLLLAFVALAIEPGPSSVQQRMTETWLLLQIHDQLASPIQQTATHIERELTLQRWMDSYKHPIPEYYKDYSSSSGSK